MTEFRTGQTIEVYRPAHPYEHMGFVDTRTVVPEYRERLRLVCVGQQGNRLTLRRPDNTGFGIDVKAYEAGVPGSSVTVVSD
jgi:hypothetical protein